MKNDLTEKGNIQVSESNKLIIKNQGTGKWYTLLASNSIKDRCLIDTSVEGHKEYAVVKGLDFRDGTWCFPNKKILRNSPCLPACKQKNIATRLRDTT